MPSVLQMMMSNMAAALGVVFNGYILFVFIWNRKINTPNSMLLLHLAFADTIFSLFILSYNTALSGVLQYDSNSISYGIVPKNSHIATFHNSTSFNLCQAHGFLWTLLPIVIVWNVCGLSFDRYAAIYRPLHYSRVVSVKRVIYFLVCSWILGAILAIPPLVNVCPYTFWDARWACTANCLFNTDLIVWYPVTYTIFAAILPVLIILLCNLHMLFISKYHRHSILTAIYKVTVNAQATVTHQRHPCYLSKFKGRNAFYTIVQIVGLLLVFTIPYYGVFIWEVTNGTESNPVLIAVTTFFLTCTPPMNAYVYGIKSRILRQTLKRLLYQHLHPTDSSHRDIKRRLSEIFSDRSTKSTLSRRLSAPADVGNEISRSTDTTRKKTPFTRSISLPVHAPITITQTKPSVQVLKEKRLTRGESAPEDDITPCELTEDSTTLSWKRKRELYARSSSFPLQHVTSYRTRRKQIMKAHQEKFVSICVRVDEDQPNEGLSQVEDK